jgi:uncharacterized membrane-anchored protein YhcB (DUF1043 family)
VKKSSSKLKEQVDIQQQMNI